MGATSAATNGTTVEPLLSRSELGRGGALGVYCGGNAAEQNSLDNAVPVHFVVGGILAAATLVRAVLWRLHRGQSFTFIATSKCLAKRSAALRGLAPLHVYVGLLAPFHAAAAVVQAATALAHCTVVTAAVAVVLHVTSFGGTGPLSAVHAGFLWSVLLVVPGAVAAVAVRTPLHVLCTLRHVVDRRRLYLAACRRLGAAPKRPLPTLEFPAPVVASSTAAADLVSSSSSGGDAVSPAGGGRGLAPVPPVPRWDYGAACGPSRPHRPNAGAGATSNTSSGESDDSRKRLVVNAAGLSPLDETANGVANRCTNESATIFAAMGPGPDASAGAGMSMRCGGGRGRGTPSFSAATHARVSCARTQMAALALAVAVAAAAVAVAAVASSGWCPAAMRRYGVLAAAALAVDCAALQVLWVSAVALWRWMTAPATATATAEEGNASAASLVARHPPYPQHGAWSSC
jgi:hypothetical protein